MTAGDLFSGLRGLEAGDRAFVSDQDRLGEFQPFLPAPEPSGASREPRGCFVGEHLPFRLQGGVPLEPDEGKRSGQGATRFRGVAGGGREASLQLTERPADKPREVFVERPRSIRALEGDELVERPGAGDRRPGSRSFRRGLRDVRGRHGSRPPQPLAEEPR